MSFFNVALVFLITWWLGFFLALPFGVKAPDKVEPGHASSAPPKPRLWIKAGAATVIAAVLTVIIFVIVESSWIDLRE